MKSFNFEMELFGVGKFDLDQTENENDMLRNVKSVPPLRDEKIIFRALPK